MRRRNQKTAASLKSPMTLSSSTTIRSMVQHGSKHWFPNPSIQPARRHVPINSSNLGS